MSARGKLSGVEVALAFLIGLGMLFMISGGLFGVTFLNESTQGVSGGLFWLGLVALVAGVLLWLGVVKPWTQFDDINVPLDTGHYHAEGHDEEAHDEPDHVAVVAVTAEPVAAAEFVEPDDLRRIEGIGPKISSILNEAGLTTFAQMAAMDAIQLEQIIRSAGVRLGDPTTWSEQASLAAAGDWDGLESLQDSLSGGRRV